MCTWQATRTRVPTASTDSNYFKITAKQLECQNQRTGKQMMMEWRVLAQRKSIKQTSKISYDQPIYTN